MAAAASDPPACYVAVSFSDLFVNPASLMASAFSLDDFLNSIICFLKCMMSMNEKRVSTVSEFV